MDATVRFSFAFTPAEMDPVKEVRIKPIHICWGYILQSLLIFGKAHVYVCPAMLVTGTDFGMVELMRKLRGSKFFDPASLDFRLNSLNIT